MASCYTWNYNGNKPALAGSAGDIPCPAGGACCNPGDTCVSTFMCRHAEPPANSSRPIFYISGCTDPNYSASACNKHCSQFGRTGVVYNNQTDQWACCGVDSNGQTTCANPSNEVFDFIPPDQLPTIGVAGGALATSTASSSTTSGTASATASGTSEAASASSSSSSSGGLSTGAEVGLGVGLGLGIALVLAILVYFIMNRRKKAKRAAAAAGGANTGHVAQVAGPKQDSYYIPSKPDVPPTYTNRVSPTQDPLLYNNQHHESHELGDYNTTHSELASNEQQARVELP